MINPVAFLETKFFLPISGGLALIFAAYLSTAGFGQLPILAEKTMDPLFSYPAATIFEYLAAQGQNGRAAYLLLHAVDYLFLLCFYPFLSSLLFRATRACNINSPFSYSYILPLIAALFDLSENLFIDILILRYPVQLVVPASIASFSTSAKFTLLYGTFVLLLVFLTVWIFSRIRLKKRCGFNQ